MALCTVVQVEQTACINTEETTPTTQHHIPGRYRAITVEQLSMVWWLHQAGHLTRRQLRVYFALHEMAERRRYTRRADTPRYTVEEVASLVGGRGPCTSNTSSASAALAGDLRRLATVGLATLELRGLSFATEADQLDLPTAERASLRFMLEAMPSLRRSVPVPRRLVRALAAGFSRGVTGFIIATLTRGLFWSRESKTYRCDTRTKGSWIAEVFGISRRAVTEARTRLIELGWLIPLDASQTELNRWGAHDVINLSWTPQPRLPVSRDTGSLAPGEGAVGGAESQAAEQVTPAIDPGSASPSAGFRTGSASPIEKRRPSLSRETITRSSAPVGAGPAGVSVRRKPRSAGPPLLTNLHPDHLANTGALLELYAQANARGLASASDAGRLEFIALAERARARGHDPCRLFTWLLRGGRAGFITQADEDAAHARLREHRNQQEQAELESSGGGGGEGLFPDKRPPAEPASEVDDDFVRQCILVGKQHRIDPFRVAQQVRGWTRQRWEDARFGYEWHQIQQTHAANLPDEC